MRRTTSLNASRLLLWIIVIITVISMAIPTLMKFRPLGSSSITVMTLNDQEITRAQITRRYDMLRNQIMMLQQQLAQQGTPFDVAALYNQSKEIAMQSLVHETLLDEAAKKEHITISPDYVAQKLADPLFVVQELAEFIPPYFIMQRGSLDMTLLPAMLRERGSTMQEFEAFVENNIRRHMLQSLLQAGTAIPEFLRNSACQQRYAKKQFSLLSLDVAAIKKEITAQKPSNEQLASFFEAHSNNYHIPETRSGIVYTFKPAAYDTAVSDAEVESYYQEHKRDYIVTPAQVEIRALVAKEQQKARELLAALQANPGSWNTVAKQAGITTTSKTVARADDSIWSRVAFALKEDNEIAPDVVPTPDGMAIVQRIRRLAPTYKSKVQVVDDIKKELRAQKREELLNADIARLRDAQDKGAALATLAMSKKADKRVIGATQIADNSVTKKLFATPVGQLSILKEGADLLVITTTEITPRHAASFAAVKEQVTNDWYQRRMQERLQQLLQEIKQALTSMTPAAVAKKYHMGIITSPLASVETEQQSVKKMRDAGVTNDALVYLYRPGATLVYDDATTGYILHLDAVEPVVCSAAQKVSLQKELTEQMQNAATSGFVASLYKGAKITNNQQMLGFTE